MRVSLSTHHLATLAAYPPDSTFDRRILQQAAHKAAVAIYVVQRFLGDGTSAFISDGSSTFYVGLECFYQGKGVHIYTNHLGVAHELALWPQPMGNKTKVELSSGEVNRDLMMVGGPSAEHYVREVCAKVDFIVLSVRKLFADRGPVGVEDISLRIKRDALASPSATLILVADYEKLSHPFSDDLPCVYPTSNHWLDLIRQKENFFVVSTCRPDVDYAVETTRVPQNPQTAKEHYLYNRGKLEIGLGDRFIEVRVSEPPRRASDRRGEAALA